jgi:hypothetical protein
VPEDGGGKVLRNVGIIPQHYMASQPRPLCSKEGLYTMELAAPVAKVRPV